ncbi:multidrug efflux system protein MdtL [Xenorhabdus stockiae]|uniref:Multidrug efflux system protein MdtL n=1 Tax=Xenorhabdus stockiae TaxID=351614 RepID=A0A2D0KNX9_9GAMM|nr:MFS transporter [Xenorhabdus stockiae]PHM65153.1 multidrug efflux system protein MdtL [Xenorhabdus stockiae]
MSNNTPDSCPQSHNNRMSYQAATVLHAITLMAFLAASSAPTPLYRIYQHEWGFSSTLLAVIFAAYALALLLALLIAGRLSDHIGRRPVISLALLLQIISMSTFLLASDPAWLVGARIIQGLATGLATASVGAALLDMNRERGALINSIAPMLGMAAGALGSTTLLVFAPGPLHTIYVLLLIVFLVVFILTQLAPETVQRRSGAWESLRPRIMVPVQARNALRAITPANFAVWMIGGFYLSLMPSLIVATTHTTSPWMGGLSVAALTLSGAIAIIAARKLTSFMTLLSGELALATGLLLILLAANREYVMLLLIGSVITGFGFGATFLGAIRTVLPLAEPHERGGLMGAFYIESYLANSVPTIAIGYFAHQSGLLVAVNVYGAVIIALVLLAILLTILNKNISIPLRK